MIPEGRETPDGAPDSSSAPADKLRHEATAGVPPVPSLDELIARLGGWGTLVAMYLGLGGKLSGLPPSVQEFLARELASHQPPAGGAK